MREERRCQMMHANKTHQYPHSEQHIIGSAQIPTIPFPHITDEPVGCGVAGVEVVGLGDGSGTGDGVIGERVGFGTGLGAIGAAVGS